MKQSTKNIKKAPSSAVPLIKINYKNRHFSFTFQALFSSLVVALAFAIDTLLQSALDSSHNIFVRILIQFAITFLISISVIYIFYLFFGWGDALLG
tara:strand:+ start:48 stop:335 length:288 start_codon:yes stop_codon:yes gene_type:complete